VLSNIYKTMNGLSFRTIQEGVETEEQKNLILSFGAQMIQGYFFSKPVPEDEFIEYVMKFNRVKHIS
ncbi:MAG: EAL domain-containing protein, partial [Bacilli bacterium]|nr:EAL domain-containing protein [Bacilli bacterium]